VASVGDSYDNALAESIIGLYKTRWIRRRGPWRDLEALEFATLKWVHRFNHRSSARTNGICAPAEHEAAYYRAATESAMTAWLKPKGPRGNS
jgi:transposase InsO family protein